MRVDVIDSYEQFASLRSNWESLYAIDAEAQFFLSWIWLSQLFLRRPDRLRILAAAPGDGTRDYAAFFPLRPKTRFSKSANQYTNEIFMAGNFWADYTGLICHPKHEKEAIEAFAGHLQGMHWAKLHLENIRASNRRIAILTDCFDTEIFRVTHRNRTSKIDGINNLISPHVRLPRSFDDYLRTCISANTRQKVRRFQRKFDAADALTISESCANSRARDLDALVGYWKTRWAQRKGRKVDTLARKYRKILEQGLEGGIVHMPVLRENDRPVGALASFIDTEKRCLLFFVAGRDQSWNSVPAGLMLHMYSIRWAIDNELSTYDLLRGDEQYKYSLGAQDQHIACIRIETRTGLNLGDTLDPESRNYIIKDIARRIRGANDYQKKRICDQVLMNWPNDEEMLQQCERLIIEAGQDGVAARFTARLNDLREEKSSGEKNDRLEP